ncbi:MAG: hypothetical protein KDI23_05990 [Pseudomonadales bacterium]|nr:hypothetical protein [Pseudomonadales bacterium]
MAGASIARRLSIGLAASLLLTAAALALVASVLFERALREHALGLLEDDARTVLASINSGPQGLWIDRQHLPRVFERPLSGRYFVVVSAAGTWRSRSLWDHELAVPDIAGAVPGLIAGPQGQRLLCLRTNYRRHGQSLAIMVAADVAPLLADFRRIGLLLLGLGAFAVLALTAMQRAWMRHSALDPLRQAGHQVHELTEGRRDRLDATVAVELQPLVAAINRLLAHTTQSLARSRQALGNLGHALKTPLAVLLALAERSDEPLRTKLLEQIAQMRARSRAMLTRRVEHEAKRVESLRRRRVMTEPMEIVERARERVARARVDALVAVGQRLERSASRLREARSVLGVIGPMEVLRRGYSVTLGADGKVIRSAKRMKAGERIVTVLSDGRVRSVVEKSFTTEDAQKRLTTEHTENTEKKTKKTSDGDGKDQMGLF